MKKKRFVQMILRSIAALLTLCLLGGLSTLLYFGYSSGDMWFKALYVSRLEKQSAHEESGGILFYGASNFRLWTEINEDLAPYAVINHGFGGSTDNDLMHYADRLLYPYQPSVVVFQTGSNDFSSGLSLAQAMENKEKMYSTFREQLPETVFVVLSALPLPGRESLWEDSSQLNAFLEEYCITHDRMHFVDAAQAMMQDGQFRTDYFVEDGIHLNRKGQIAWASVILPVLQEPS